MITNDYIIKALNPEGVPRVISTMKFLGTTSDHSILLDNESKTVESFSNINLVKLNPETSEGFLLKIPFVFDRILIKLVTKFDLKLLKCVLNSKKSSCTFETDSYEIKLPLNNNYTGPIHLLVYENDILLLNFGFFREPLSVITSAFPGSPDVPTISSAKVTPAKIQANPFPIPICDGPIFRETVTFYEHLIAIILKKLHTAMEKMTASEHSPKDLENSKVQMIGTFKDLKKGFLPASYKNDMLYSNFPAIDPKLFTGNELTYSFLKALHYATGETKIDTSALKSLQGFTTNKRAFEEESKKYYDWLSKLMASGKSKDEKLLSKTKHFTISQMEYFNYLYDSVTPVLLNLTNPGPEKSEAYWNNVSSRKSAIQKINSCTSMAEFSKRMQTYSSPTPNKHSFLLIDPNATYTSNTFKYPVKTDLLYVYGGQGKSGWHKQWLVLYNGKLYEYMDWRKGIDLRNAPIDVSLCNIKLLENNEHKNNNRKNCFRVITAQGVEHVFQAVTTEDASDWVKSLFEAGQMIAFTKKDGKKANGATNKEKDDLMDKAYSTSDNKFNSPRVRRLSSVSASLLKVVQHTDPSNCFCADCGATEQIEWISLNLLVVFCIQCSSAHRSLGTSVSKVRSLMLDCFVGENRALIHYINNKLANTIYESTLPLQHKPNAKSSHEDRLEFISNKYLKKLYVDDETKSNASAILMDGVKNDDVFNVLKGIAGGANVNKKLLYTPRAANPSDSSTPTIQTSDSNGRFEISLLEYALLHHSILDGHEIFDVAELLVLNGCRVGDQIRPGALVDENAKKWWQERIDKISCGSSTPNPMNNSSLAHVSIIPTTNIASGSGSSRTRPNDGKQSLSNAPFHRKSHSGSKSKIKSPKEGFNLFKKKIKNLE